MSAYDRRVATGRHQIRSAERIDRLCAEAPDGRSLRLRALDEIRQIVPFDAHVWLLTDPRSAVGSDPLADVPCLGELPRLVKFKYLTEVNRWTTLAAGGSAASSLHLATAGDPSRSLVWREVQRPYGIVDVASVVFADRFGCWGFLDLWRSGEAAPFVPADIAYLREIAPRLTEALRAAQAATFNAPAVAQPRHLGPVVMLLDDDLRVVGQTDAARDWLHALLPQRDDQPAVPASVYNVAAQLLAEEQGVDGGRPLARVHLAEGFWITLRAARLAAADPGGHGTVAVTLEETSPVDRLDVFVRGHAFSPREVDVMHVLATGGDNRAMARRLSLTENTVQDHLKSIFAKTSSHSRTELVSKALGTRHGDPATP